MTSILNWLSSSHGTQSEPAAQRLKLVVTARPPRSVAVKITWYDPPPFGVNAHSDGALADTISHVAAVSDTHSPTVSGMPSRSRRTACHSRLTTTPCTWTPVTVSPVGRTTSIATRCAVPAV